MAHHADIALFGDEQHSIGIQHADAPSLPGITIAQIQDHEHVAAAISARVTQLESEGFRDIALLSQMADYARHYYRFVLLTRPHRRFEFMLRYGGLRKFAFLLAFLTRLRGDDQWAVELRRWRGGHGGY